MPVLDDILHKLSSVVVPFLLLSIIAYLTVSVYLKYQFTVDPHVSVLDYTLHKLSPVVVPFLTLEDINALQCVRKDFNSELSVIEESSFIRTLQYKPRALVKHFLKYIEGDRTSDDQNNRDLWNNQVTWEFANQDETGETQRFDMNVPNAQREHLLLSLFLDTFGCSPARCFGLYQSLLKNQSLLENEHTLPEPEHILWTCLFLKRGPYSHDSRDNSTNESSNDRSASFVGALNTTEFELKLSSLISFVSDLFDEESKANEKRSLSPTRYNEGFFPYPVKKSAFYISVFILGEEGFYEYEFAADLPPFINVGGELVLSGSPGYISHVAVRHHTEWAQRGERELDFYQESLRMKLQEGEMVVMADWTKVPSVLRDSILSWKSIHNGEGMSTAARLESILAARVRERVITAIRLESTRINEIKEFFLGYYLLIYGTEDEATQLGNAKFVAHLINIGMAQQNE